MAILVNAPRTGLRTLAEVRAREVTRPFKILGVQQIAIGGPSKAALRELWVDLLGVAATRRRFAASARTSTRTSSRSPASRSI